MVDWGPASLRTRMKMEIEMLESDWGVRCLL